MINKKRLVKLTQRLIQTPSENPGGNEAAVAAIVARELRKAGLKVKTYKKEKGRTNVVGILRGKNHKKKLLISPHTDTVPAGLGWSIPPFSGRIKNGKIYGRGAEDCKCNVAAVLEAVRSLKEKNIKLDNDLIIAATSDEETGSRLGLIYLLKNKIIRPTEALILDGDEFLVLVAQKGAIHFKIIVYGKKAHGAYPWLGENAILKAMEIIKELKNMKFVYKKHPLLREPTINIGTISGGTKINMVPDRCEIGVDLRYLPGMNNKKIILSIRKKIKKIMRHYKVKKYDIVGGDLSSPPYVTTTNQPLVDILKKSVKKIRRTVKIAGIEGATVMSFFKAYKIPAISTGFGKEECAHATNEYIDIKDLVDGARVLEDFIKSYLGVAK